jgi:formylglycine-generating enzyme required for sulfatase activity
MGEGGTGLAGGTTDPGSVSPGPNESLPISCVKWHWACAFCIWDGGRLPTEAEWNYAAAGGNEQRVFPWGSAQPNDSSAVYCSWLAGELPDGDPLRDGGDRCFGSPRPGVPAPVGSKSPNGDGRWGHADLAGNLWEWTRDRYFNPYTQVPCNDCANLAGDGTFVVRGGSLHDAPHIAAGILPWEKPAIPDGFSGGRIGFRCARNPP